MRAAGNRAIAKLIESFPDIARDHVTRARARFRFDDPPTSEPDPRLPALALAVRESRVVTVRAHTANERRIHPLALVCGPADWHVEDALLPDQPVALSECGNINISARRFAPQSAP